MRFSCLVLALCVFLSGCTRYVAWGKKTFYQVNTYSSLRDALAPYIRSAYEYDMLRTVIRADILWVNRAVREIHAEAVAQRRLLEKEVESVETSGTTIFYVFIAPTLDLYPPLSATDSRAVWAVHAGVHGQWYTPEAIDLLELDQEYQMLVGAVSNRYRMAYKVVFPCAIADTEPIELRLTSAAYRVPFVWNVS